MITVTCVLKSGGDFRPEHVAALKRGVKKHLTVPHLFCEMTDGPGCVGLLHNLPGWWSKMELFRPNVFDGPVLYFDLDTVIVRSIDALAKYSGQFAMLADFYEPSRFQTGIMAWTPGPHTDYLWERFIVDPARTIKRFRGDANYLRAIVEPRPDVLQDLFPRQIVSYKRDVLLSKASSFVDPRTWRVPDEASVVCFHGQPRPWKTPLWEMDT